MINIELIKYCLSCPDIDISTKVTRFYSDNEAVSACGEVSCSRQNDCEAYRIITEMLNKPTITQIVRESIGC